MLAALAKRKLPFFRFALDQSERHRRWLAEPPLTSEELDLHEERATQSFAEQARIEAEDQGSFDAFLEHYLAPPE